MEGEPWNQKRIVWKKGGGYAFRWGASMEAMPEKLPFDYTTIPFIFERHRASAAIFWFHRTRAKLSECRSYGVCIGLSWAILQERNRLSAILKENGNIHWLDIILALEAIQAHWQWENDWRARDPFFSMTARWRNGKIRAFCRTKNFFKNFWFSCWQNPCLYV